MRRRDLLRTVAAGSTGIALSPSGLASATKTGAANVHVLLREARADGWRPQWGTLDGWKIRRLKGLIRR